MGQFKIITQDFRNAIDKDRANMRVCHGKIDFSRLYCYIVDANEVRGLTEAELKVVSEAYTRAGTMLNRCQQDLIRIEFGEDDKLYSQVCFATDTLIKDSPEANVAKLKDAIQKVTTCLLEVCMENIRKTG